MDKWEIIRFLNKIYNYLRYSWIFWLTLSFLVILSSITYEVSGNYRVRIILVIIIYLCGILLWVRWLKLGFTNVSVSGDIKMYYNNLSLLLLNISLFSFMFFTMILELDLPNEVLGYIKEKKMSSMTFLIGVILLLFLVTIIIAFRTFKLRKKEVFIGPMTREKYNDVMKYRKKMIEVRENTLVVRYFSKYAMMYNNTFDRILSVFPFSYLFIFFILYLGGYSIGLWPEALVKIVYNGGLILWKISEILVAIWWVFALMHVYVFLKSSWYGIVWNPEPKESLKNVRLNNKWTRSRIWNLWSSNYRARWFVGWISVSYFSYRIFISRYFQDVEGIEDDDVRRWTKYITNYPSDDMLDKFDAYPELKGQYWKDIKKREAALMEAKLKDIKKEK